MSEVAVQITFDDLVKGCVQESISKVKGETAWKAVLFYFDPTLAVKEPGSFGRLLDQLFGTGTSSEIQKAIVSILMQKIGSPTVPLIEGKRLDDWYDTGVGSAEPRNPGFQDWIQRARVQFKSSGWHFRPGIGD